MHTAGASPTTLDPLSGRRRLDDTLLKQRIQSLAQTPPTSDGSTVHGSSFSMLKTQPWTAQSKCLPAELHPFDPFDPFDRVSVARIHFSTLFPDCGGG